MKVGATAIKREEASMVKVVIGRKPMYLTNSEAWDLLDALSETLTAEMHKGDKE